WRMRCESVALRGVVGHVEIHTHGVRLAVVGEDVVLEAERMLNLRLKQGSAALPFAKRIGKAHEARSLGHQLLPPGKIIDRASGRAQQEKARQRRQARCTEISADRRRAR